MSGAVAMKRIFFSFFTELGVFWCFLEEEGAVLVLWDKGSSFVVGESSLRRDGRLVGDGGIVLGNRWDRE